MGAVDGKGWTNAKMLALVIPLCIAVIAAAVTLVLVLGKGDTAEQTASEEKANGEEEIVDNYEETKQEADTTMA